MGVDQSNLTSILIKSFTPLLPGAFQKKHVASCKHAKRCGQLGMYIMFLG
jgi:hypothetical protein